MRAMHESIDHGTCVVIDKLSKEQVSTFFFSDESCPDYVSEWQHILTFKLTFILSSQSRYVVLFTKVLTLKIIFLSYKSDGIGSSTFRIFKGVCEVGFSLRLSHDNVFENSSSFLQCQSVLIGWRSDCIRWSRKSIEGGSSPSHSLTMFDTWVNTYNASQNQHSSWYQWKGTRWQAFAYWFNRNYSTSIHSNLIAKLLDM